MNLLSGRGPDLVSVVHIRQSPYYRGFFKENMWEFCRDIILETVRNRELSVFRELEVSVPRGSTVI